MEGEVSKGKLFIFEGPNGVGKTTLSQLFCLRLRERGIDPEWYSFPGRRPGTLGNLIYRLHHEPEKLGVWDSVSVTSRQALHVAAHIDAIQRQIIPALEAGKWVVLDRYWWSTKVYGLLDGVPPQLLDAIIRPEILAWGDTIPSAVFLLDRSKSLRIDYSQSTFDTLRANYLDVALTESASYQVNIISNEGLVDETIGAMLANIDNLC
jgi:dTMP kinase